MALDPGQSLAGMTNMKAEAFKELYRYALRCLTRRDHSTQELIQKLNAKAENPEWVHDVIAQLKAKNYLNDSRFAEMYARMRANKGYGKLRIQAELKEKGITENITIQTDIKNIYEKKFGKHVPKDLAEKAKRVRYLQYKGFSFEEIKKVLNHDDE